MGLADCVLIMPVDSNRRDDVEQLASGPCTKHGFRVTDDHDHIAFGSSPLAIAFLGSGKIDATVALLVGFRTAARRPTVLLYESGNVSASQPAFQSMIKSLSNTLWEAVPIPAALDDDDERNAAIDRIDDAIRAALSNARRANQRYRSHPYVEFRFDRTTNECQCTAESSNARLFFNWKNKLVGVSASDLIEHLLTMFYEPQKEKFLEDQGGLFERLLAPPPPLPERKERVLWATYPAVFQNHPDPNFNEKAFLPIIVSNTTDERYTHLSVLYLEINSVTEMEEDTQQDDSRSVRFVSKLKVPWTKLSIFMRSGYDVFLAHNSKDKDAVRQINDGLTGQGVRSYFDDTEIEAGALWEQLAAAISNSCTTAIFLGKEGLGPWQGKFELVGIIQRAIREDSHKIIPILLPGVDRVPSDLSFLEGFAYVKFESLDNLEANDEFQKLVRFIKKPAKAGRAQLAGNQ
jgi:hypothetical protein